MPCELPGYVESGLYRKATTAKNGETGGQELGCSLSGFTALGPCNGIGSGIESAMLHVKADGRAAFSSDVDVVEARDADGIDAIVGYKRARDRDRFDRLVERAGTDHLHADDRLLTKDPGDRTGDCVGTRLR